MPRTQFLTRTITDMQFPYVHVKILWVFLKFVQKLSTDFVQQFATLSDTHFLFVKARKDSSFTTTKVL